MDKRTAATHYGRTIDALDALEVAMLADTDGLTMLRVGQTMQAMHRGSCDQYLRANDPSAPKLSELDLLQFLVSNRLLASYLVLREKYDLPEPAAFLRAVFEHSRQELHAQWAANDAKQAVAG